MFVRMKRDYPYPVDGQKGVTRTLPAGWSGEVDEALGKAVMKAGAGVMQGKARKGRKAAATGEASGPSAGGDNAAPEDGAEGGEGGAA